MSTFLKGKRTIIFNTISAIVVVATTATGTITDPKWLAVMGIIIAIGNGILRIFTDTSIGKAS